MRIDHKLVDVTQTSFAPQRTTSWPINVMSNVTTTSPGVNTGFQNEGEGGNPGIC